MGGNITSPSKWKQLVDYGPGPGQWLENLCDGGRNLNLVFMMLCRTQCGPDDAIVLVRTLMAIAVQSASAFLSIGSQVWLAERRPASMLQ